MNGFGGISDLTTAKRGRSRSVNAENPTGEKGKGGMAPSNLGPSRKGSPCLRNLASGSVTTLADIKGPGVINHIWITVADQTEKDYYVLLLRLCQGLYRQFPSDLRGSGERF